MSKIMNLITYDTPLPISDFAKKPSKLLFFQQII